MAHFLFRNKRLVTAIITSSELASMLRPTVERLGYELSDLEAKIGGSNGFVRLFIDAEAGVSLEDCEKVSRAVSALLDVEDPLPGSYNLEVSSPGADRKLTRPAHFERFLGATVKVQMRLPIAGRRRFRGTLLTSGEQNIVVEVDGVAHTLPLANIEVARLVP